MTAPLFSVVIPTYNCADKIGRAVQSVLDQTLSDYDIWVIDDGSTDGTRSALERVATRINYVYQPNQGVAVARNRGIERARGDYVAFLDADDWWYPPKLERVAQAIRLRPSAGLFYSQVDLVDQAGSRLWTYRSLDRGAGNYRALLEADFVMTSSVVAKATCVAHVGGFDGEVVPCEDWDLWIRIARVFAIHLIPEILVAHEHMVGGSLSSDTLRWAQAHDRVVEKVFASDAGLTGSVRQRVQSAVHYRKGKIYLAARDEPAAVQEFRQSIAHNRANWQSWLYWLVLRHPTLQRWIPRRARRALRLPETNSQSSNPTAYA